MSDFGACFAILSLKNIWESWLRYRKGKKVSRELLVFQYNIEENLQNLFFDLNDGTYQHGGYRTFIVTDNKTREISVAGIRDRVVHRLMYDYLNGIYDETFVYDAWSCRTDKGLTAAIIRAQKFFRQVPGGFVWRADVKKFFDSVNHDVLLGILLRRVKDPKTFQLTEKIIRSFSKEKERSVGMPIGNLTSQIFANIYLNELDRFVKHELKPQAYLRYGDDFILIDSNRENLIKCRNSTIVFLQEKLKLSVNSRNDFIRKIKQGLEFLGVVIYSSGRRLNRRNRIRIQQRLNLNNVGSHFGLLTEHENPKRIRQFHWKLSEKISSG